MAITPINVGTSANDGTGDPHRTAFQKTNNNITEVTTNGGAVINVTDPVDLATKELNDALANIYASGGGATPDLPTVLAQGNRGIKTLSALTDYEFVLEDRGKRIFQTQAVNNTLNAGVFEIGDTIIFFNDCGIDVNITEGTDVFINVTTPTIENQVGGILTYRSGTSPEVWNFSKIPYEISSGGVTDGDKGDITVGSGGTVWTIDNGVVDNAKVASGIDAVKIADGSVSNTEFQRLNGVTSDIQPQLNQKDVLPVLYEKHANVPAFGSASLNNLEGVAFTVQGGLARSFSDTNVYTRRQRMGLVVSVTGNLAQARQTITYFNRNSNIHVIVGVGFAENCTTSNVRAFAGISSVATFSNVEPTSLTNCFGIAKLTTSNNLHLVHNDGSGTATAVDLGASFPTNTIETDFYLLEVKTNGSNLDYVVTRVNNGDTASGSISTDIPATTQALNLGYYVVQSTGANTTTGIDYFGANLIKS